MGEYFYEPGEQPIAYLVETYAIGPTSRPQDVSGFPLLDSRPAVIKGALKAPELCCLATDYDEARHPERAGAEIKLDGFRLIGLIDDQPRLISREGQNFAFASHCVKGLANLRDQYGKPMMFDGEIVHDDGFEALQAAYHRGVPDPKVSCYLFDAAPLDQWRTNTVTASNGTSTTLLRKFAAKCDRPFVGVLAQDLVTASEAKALARRLYSVGYEGVVVKDSSAPYRRERSGAWQRMKRTETMDVRVVEMRGTPKRGLTHMVCRTAGGVTFMLSITPKAFASMTDCWAGAIVEIIHNGLTANGSPRHARFNRVRDDKVTF